MQLLVAEFCSRNFLTRKRGANMGKIAMKGFDILSKQYRNRTVSRNEVKEANKGRYARYDTVSSNASLVQHQKQWAQFAKYVEDKHGLKGLKKIDHEHVREFIKHEQARGLSEKTLKSRVTAINHVMIGSRVWEPNQRVSLTSMRSKGHILASKGPTNVYKDLTALEFRMRNPGVYEANKDVIDFSRAFGLRRSEIFGKKGSEYQGVTFRNLGHVEGSNKLFVEVIGKGGKYRLAPVREDMRAQMWAKYGSSSRVYTKEYLSKPVSERETMLKSRSKASERLFQSESRKFGLHINRNEYVERQLRERQEYWESKVGKMTDEIFQNRQTGYSRIGFKYNEETGRTLLYKTYYKNGERVIESVRPFETVQIGNWRGYAISATDVSRFVGHNRLDVLQKYL